MSLINVVENEKLIKSLQKLSNEISKLAEKVKVLSTKYKGFEKGNFAILSLIESSSKTSEASFINVIKEHSVALDILSPVLSTRMIGFLEKEFNLNLGIPKDLNKSIELQQLFSNIDKTVYHPFYTEFLPAVRQAKNNGDISQDLEYSFIMMAFYAESHSPLQEMTDTFLHNTYIQLKNIIQNSNKYFFERLFKGLNIPFIDYNKNETILNDVLPKSGLVFGYKINNDSVEASPIIVSLSKVKSINLHEYIRDNPSSKKSIENVQFYVKGQLVQYLNNSSVYFIPRNSFVFSEGTSFHNRVCEKGYEINLHHKMMKQLFNPSETTLTTGSLIRYEESVGYINEISGIPFYEIKNSTVKVALTLYSPQSNDFFSKKVDGTKMSEIKGFFSSKELENIKKASDRDVAVFLHFSGV